VDNKIMDVKRDRFQSVIVRNLLAMVLLQAGNFLVPLLTLPYLARILGVHSFGTYSFSLAVMVALGVFVEWGFPLSATAAVSTYRYHPGKLAELLGSTLGAKLVLLSTSAVILTILCYTVEAFQASRSVLPYAYGLVIAYVINLGWFLQGIERMSRFAVTSLLARCSTVPAILLLVHRSDDVWLALLIQSVGALAAAVLSIALVAREGGLNIKVPNLNLIISRLNEGKHFFLAAAAINMYTASTVIIVGLVRDPTTVAVYAGADRIKSAAQNVISPLSQVFYPRIVSLFRSDRPRAEAAIQNLIWLFGTIGLAVSLSLFFFADLAVSFLLGDRFKEAANVLRILAPIPLISALSNVLSVQAMVPLNLAGARSKVLIYITLLSIPLTFVFARSEGYFGAATVVLLCEFTGLLSFYIIARKRIPIFRPLNFPLI
jgi:PST family polysaccharide transporter